MAIALIYCMLSTPVSAVDGHKECLECLYEHRKDGNYFCGSTKACLAEEDTRCAIQDMVTDYFGCVGGFEPCQNMTFTSGTF